MAAARAKPREKHVHNARPDTVDFRDQIFVATLVEVPTERSLSEYKRFYKRATGRDVPILNQGLEGACTGFGLAALCNYLLGTRAISPSLEPVSPRMMYEMAKRYDEWQGDDYEGSSARGAMKGWHRHGVCREKAWPYAKEDDGKSGLNNEVALDASERPLGAYFRVNHRDLVAMHAAIAEVGILYATAGVHEGWNQVDRKTGVIPYRGGSTGGHAFAVVGFDARGFWIQNSWGQNWGMRGFARIGYEDWLENGYDVWVARLGAPIYIEGKLNLGVTVGGLETAQFSFQQLRRHIISIGNDGKLRSKGTYGSSEADVAELFAKTIPEATKNWKSPRLLLYAHGGLVDEDGAVQRVQDYLEPLLAAEVYPVAFIWKTNFWATLKNLLADSLRGRRPAEMAGGAKDFLWDRIDDTVERLARLLQGQRIWNEMKENAVRATMYSEGGARLAAVRLGALLAQQQRLEVHMAAHSAGAIFMAPLAQLLTCKGNIPPDSLLKSTKHRWDPVAGLAQTIKTCTLWAPACTNALFHEAYLPAINAQTIGATSLFTLSDGAEQDDHCANLYHKSLLYLVSNALEERPRKIFEKDGEWILGMDKFVKRDKVIAGAIRDGSIQQVIAPNSNPPGQIDASCATQHGAFDDDKPTLLATLARICDAKLSHGDFSFSRSAASAREKRRELVERFERA